MPRVGAALRVQNTSGGALRVLHTFGPLEITLRTKGKFRGHLHLWRHFRTES